MTSRTTGPRSTTGLRFTKGHGTHNDFVLVADTRGDLELTPEQVRTLADRRGGIGGDGVIRLAPTAAIARAGEAVADQVLAEEPAAIWFMDYRNADGSVAEMCGNGVRVFTAFAESLGLVDLDTTELALGTRAGVKRVRKETGPDGVPWYAVDLGPWRLPGGAEAAAAGADAAVAVRGWAAPRPALSVDLGNPHTVVALGSTDELARIDLTQAPQVAPPPPHGTNVELVVPLEETTSGAETAGRVRMRVHERGVGETQSCGTGAVAAALAVRTWAAAGGRAPVDTWFVEVPGGLLRVRVLTDGHAELAGPAQLVFSGETTLV
ncbi:diaminopimelate epimerase [Xylanimonas cellulosilytica DSM 15894]|uniref:Diaminopimelate epimerase n=1 Tax=Xylanimonas cellulosilytica (strain DSM 15894 / JCM 12276 / CECT 5975 / KCTC 9989 / LMG 20990 / NBRC 107835 / XIL07) TaxID=446471 RepID=D1C095_XYLCX|nr:diaminopimelate epimerase [Xylanimonas cellulosilytica]ACZ30284.1 diaminopimelate epimerase [Xylanimonas cellulosilytica DSM 15894]